MLSPVPFRRWRHVLEHVLFVQKVRPGKRDLYVEAHRDPPADLLRVLRDSGVKREIIWLQGENIYIYVMSDEFDKAIADQGKSRVFQDWVQRMTPLLSEIQDFSGEGTVVRLPKVFDLEEQLERIGALPPAEKIR
jgi:L-rhamnose mutarotase